MMPAGTANNSNSCTTHPKAGTRHSFSKTATKANEAKRHPHTTIRQTPFIPALPSSCSWYLKLGWLGLLVQGEAS